MIENVDINLRKLLLEQQGTFKGLATVVFAEDHKQRAGEIDQSCHMGLASFAPPPAWPAWLRFMKASECWSIGL
jgi:hypothetical protein